MLFGLLPLLVLGAVVALIVRAVRNHGGRVRESGTVSLRRFFQYLTLYGVLVVVAIGFTGLLEQLLPGGGTVIRRGSTESARALAFVLVGVPVYLGLGAWVNRQLDDPRERRSFGWSFYLTATLFTALLVAGYSAFELLTWAFGVEPFDKSTLARGLVWGAVWVGHWLIVSRYLDAPRGEGHLILGSAVGLGAVSGAIGAGIFVILDAMYSNLFEVGVASNFGDDMATVLAGLVVGGGIWSLYWLRHGVRLARTPLWHGYVLLFGVLGGVTTAIGAGTAQLYSILEWLFGRPDATTAAVHFDITPGLVASGLAGLGVFFYHRAVLAEKSAPERTEIRRIYEYTLGGVGLLGFAGGITVLLVAFIQQLVPASDVLAGESEVNTLLIAVTFLLVGGPLWWGFWSRIQRARAAAPEAELRSRTRRAYLALLFGVGGVTALSSLVVAVFMTLEDMLDGRFGGETMADIAPALALVITTGAIAAYHWLIYKEDRAEAPAALESPLREVILLGVGGNGVASRLADQLDVRVQVWDRLDVPGGEVSPEAIVAELEGQTHERVLVIAWEDGHHIVPFAGRR